MHFEGGGVLVFPGMMAPLRLETLELGGVMTRLCLIPAGFRLGQFLTVFGDVGFDGFHAQNCNPIHLTRWLDC